MNYAEVYAAADQITSVVENQPAGRKNDAAIREIKRQARIIRSAGAVGYILTKLSEIEEHADCLYSARKHRRYDKPQLSGEEQLKLWIIRNANSIAAQTRDIERIAKEGGS